MKKISFLFAIVLSIAITNRAYAQHPILAVIDSSKTVISSVAIGSAPDQYAQSQVNIANKLISTAQSIAADTDQSKMDFALRDLRKNMALYFVPNSQLPITVNSFTEDFNGIVDSTFWTTNAGGDLNTTGMQATIENNAIKYSCLSYTSFWQRELWQFSNKQLLLNLNDNRYVSFKAKVDPGATWDGIAEDSARVSFDTGDVEYFTAKVPTDGNWHNVTFDLGADKDYSAVWRFMVSPGLSINDGAVGHEFIGTIWIDDFKAGSAAKSEVTILLKNVNDTKLSLYPNPVVNELTISKVAPNSILNIYSAIGQLVLVKKLTQVENVNVNLQQLHSGTYIVRLTSDQGVITEKFNKK